MKQSNVKEFQIVNIYQYFIFQYREEKMTDNRKSWSIHQDQSILSVVSSVGTKNWPLVSQLMKEKYQLNQRSGKQCRERWHNHLNPELNKLPWSETQEQLLFQAHRKYGNRWIQISKLFGGRTDNSIKNHFYSTIRRSMRRVCKILGNRNSTSKLRNIRPSVLSQIFQFSKKHQMKSVDLSENIDIASSLLQYAKEKPKRSSEFDPSSKDDLEMLVNRLIFLNEQYVNFKNEKKTLNIQAKPTKKPSSRAVVQKVSVKKEEWSQTNTTTSQGENFERQHRDHLSESNILSTLIHDDHQNSLSLIQQTQEDVSDVSICEEELEIQSLEDHYLIIKPVTVHSMFESTQNFNEKQHQIFYYMEKPSFQEIACLDHQQIDQQSKQGNVY